MKKSNFMALAVLCLSTLATAQPTPETAISYIEELDIALTNSERIFETGQMKEIHRHSKRINELSDKGKVFGQSIFDKPYGWCFGAGIDAASVWNSLWQNWPGDRNDVIKGYKDKRKACLDAAKEQKKPQKLTAKEKAELKKKECLTVYDVDTATGKLITLPKPSHCKKL